MRYYVGRRAPGLPAPGGSRNRRKGAREGFLAFLRGGVSAPLRRGRWEEKVFYRPFRPVRPPQNPPVALRKSGTRRAEGGLGRAAVLLAVLGAALFAKARAVDLMRETAGFRLERVVVTGNRFLREDAVREAAGLKKGTNMFELDLEAVRDRVAALPWVEHAFVERRLPRTVVVAVRERKPFALVDSGALFGVTERGILLPPSEELLSEDLPLLSGVAVGAEAAGTTRLAEILEPGLRFLRFLKDRDEGLAADVSEVNLSHPGTLRVVFLDGLEARFSESAGERDLQRMAAVLSDLARRGERAAVMDFRYRDQVVVETR